MDQELRAYLEEREARMEARMDERFARLDERFEKVETEARQTRVLIEGLHGNVRLLAEGVIATGERIDALRVETAERLDEIKGSVAMVHKYLVPRMKALEDRAERESLDVLDVIREKFGHRQVG